MSNASDSPSLQASVNPSTAKLGDLITLFVDANAPAGSSIQLNLPKELGTFEVAASTAQNNRFLIQLQNFTTGQQLLPGIDFVYREGQKPPQTLKTPEFKVLIEMIPPGPKDNPQEIRGIKGVLGPVGISPWWWMLLVFALVVGGAAWWSHRRTQLQGPPPPPPEPADETALKKLQELLTLGWVEGGQVKEFYIAISDTLRAYLENGFDCPALERTTSELMRDVRQRSLFPSDKLLALKQLLKECDLVKFAKFRPDAGESLKMHALAVQFVEQTRKALQTPSTAGRGN